MKQKYLETRKTTIVSLHVMVNLRIPIKNIFIVFGEFLQWEPQWDLEAFNSL